MNGQSTPTSIERLRIMFKGQRGLRRKRLYVCVRNVAKNGMSREVDAYIIARNVPYCITLTLADALDLRLSKAQRIRMGGCGYNVADHLASLLSDAIGIRIHHDWI